MTNYPPGVYEWTPNAPWNQEEDLSNEDLLDFIYDCLEEDNRDPEYQGMSIKVGKYRVLLEDI